MTFDAFLKIVPKIINENLPAEASHTKFDSVNRIEAFKKLDFEKLNYKSAAVMMLVYPKNNAAHLVLIVRNAYDGVHSNQIAFPGGKVDFSDASLWNTALRETHEEIGVSEEKIQFVKNFSPVYIPPSNFMAHPFLGFSNDILIFNTNEREVFQTIELPVSELLNENNISTSIISNSYITNIEVPVFKFQEHIVWGATAIILSELKDILNNVVSDL